MRELYKVISYLAKNNRTRNFRAPSYLDIVDPLAGKNTPSWLD